MFPSWDCFRLHFHRISYFTTPPWWHVCYGNCGAITCGVHVTGVWGNTSQPNCFIRKAYLNLGKVVALSPTKGCGCGPPVIHFFPSASRGLLDSVYLQGLSPNGASVSALRKWWCHFVLNLHSEDSCSPNRHRRICHTIQTCLTGDLKTVANRWLRVVRSPRRGCTGKEP